MALTCPRTLPLGFLDLRRGRTGRLGFARQGCLFASLLFIAAVPVAQANYIFDWLPLDGTAATGSIEISDAAHAAGSFGLADIVRFEFVEPSSPFFPVRFTWNSVTSATGTISTDGLFIASLTLAANTSTVVDDYHYLTVVTVPTSYQYSLLLTANNIFGRQYFLGGWGHGHQVDNPVPDAGSSLTLLGSALAGLGLWRRKRT